MNGLVKFEIRLLEKSETNQQKFIKEARLKTEHYLLRVHFQTASPVTLALKNSSKEDIVQ
jgi:hypothetical protein